jgi:lysophospholipase L1-like esterase
MTKKDKIIASLIATVIMLAVFYLYYRDMNKELRIPVNTPNEKITYVSLGDSLTSGSGADNYETGTYPYMLSQKMGDGTKEVIFKNLGIAGITSKGLIEQELDKAIEAQPDIITLLIGVNDIHHRVSAKEFKNNYQTIINKLRINTKAEIYLIDIPFIGYTSTEYSASDPYYDTTTKEFNKIIKELSAGDKLHYVSLYTPTKVLFMTSGDHYWKDSFHPSTKGYRIWADTILISVSNKKLEKFKPVE